MKKAAGIIGLILAIGFVVLGFTTTIPDKYISSYGSNKMMNMLAAMRITLSSKHRYVVVKYLVH